jgi:rRNA maturation endonuclease Nob1
LEHLVIDTNYILSKVNEFNAKCIYTTQQVIDEVKDEQSL